MGNELVYFASPKQGLQKGKLTINKDSVINLEPDIKNKKDPHLTFSITTDERSLFVTAESKSALDEWYNILSRVIIIQNNL